MHTSPTYHYSDQPLPYVYTQSQSEPQLLNYSSEKWYPQFQYNVLLNQQAPKPQSIINYVPYQRTMIDYQNHQRIQKIPKVRKIQDFYEQKYIQQVPREVSVVDYMAVENIRQYHKEVVPEKRIQMVPVEKKIKIIQYIPMTKQYIHEPLVDRQVDYAQMENSGYFFSQKNRYNGKQNWQNQSFGQKTQPTYLQNINQRSMPFFYKKSYSRTSLPQTMYFETYGSQTAYKK